MNGRQGQLEFFSSEAEIEMPVNWQAKHEYVSLALLSPWPPVDDPHPTKLISSFSCCFPATFMLISTKIAIELIRKILDVPINVTCLTITQFDGDYTKT
jgi:hypothetical protein